MERKLVSFLKKLSIEKDEIDNLVQLCPGLDLISDTRAKANVKIVVDAGFPIFDVSNIIYSNPSFLLHDPQDLQKIIDLIDGDIETELKNNPFLI